MPTADIAIDDALTDDLYWVRRINELLARRCEAALWRAVAESHRVKLYVWGAGKGGRITAAALRRRGGTIAGFVESSGERAGQRLDGCAIVTTSDLLAERANGQTPFVLVASSFAAAIASALEEMNWPTRDVLFMDATALVLNAEGGLAEELEAAQGGLPPLNSLGQRFTSARPLEERHLRNCRVLPDRYRLLAKLPRGGVVAELGTHQGNFACQILSQVRPDVLHIADIDLRPLKRDRLEQARGETVVHLHEGDSSAYLMSLPDHTFDWIYIDGDHSREGVQRDAYAAMRKIKPEGLLVFNDYTAYSPIQLCPYGIMEVVHNLCLDHGFEIIHLALNGLGYHDVALRRRREDA
jgi:hypothetical protein